MKNKHDLKELTNLLNRTREELEAVNANYFCVASAVADKRADIIYNDMFYNLFREAWFDRDKNGKSNDMKKLLENAVGREVTDLYLGRTEWDVLFVDFTDSKNLGRYSIQIPVFTSKDYDIGYDICKTERTINSIAIKLYSVGNNTFDYNTIISFPDDMFDCGVRDRIREFFESI